MLNLRKFVFKVFIGSFPIAIFCFLALILYYGGEYKSIPAVYNYQQKNPNSLFGPAFSNPDIEYKVYSILSKRPQTLILGTSRVMQFKQIDTKMSFYNGGGAIGKIGDYKILLNHLIGNGYRPSKLVIGLDQYFFNSSWDKVKYDPVYSSRISNVSIEMKPNIKRVFMDLVKGKISAKCIFESENIGINAKMNSNGFNPDGSYYYGGFVEKGVRWDPGFADTFKRIENQGYRFEYADHINPDALEQYEEFVQICIDNKIELVAILPPYAPSVIDKMKKSGHYGYINEIYPAVKSIMKSGNYQAYDFTEITNTTNEEYYDGFHGGDSVYLEIAKNIGL